MKYFFQSLFCAVLLLQHCCPASAQLVIFEENFDQLQLRGPVDENSSISQAFTHNPPSQWQLDVQGVPAVGDPDIGVVEWEGWSFANKDFWIDVSGDERRSEFNLGQGTIAVADPDEWNDLGFPSVGGPANVLGFYNTFLDTPVFDIGTIREKGNRLKFKFDSSWRPQCCDDGEQFDPNGNNQTATIRARFEDGSTVDLLRWESSPFFDSLGRPSTDPNDVPNPNFKDIATNEILYLDLSQLLFTNHLEFKLEFGMINAGDDYWWAMDNMQAISLTTVLGDMDLNGVLDEDDIDDFAAAIHSTKNYIATHLGEFPATRGSLDSVFDFDDIDWFVNLLNGGGVAATRATILAAIEAQAVPEPSTDCFTLLVLCAGLARRRARS